MLETVQIYLTLQRMALPDPCEQREEDGESGPVHDSTIGLGMGEGWQQEDQAEHREMETWKESSLLIPNIQSLRPEHSRKEGIRVSENDMCAAKNKKWTIWTLMKLCN